MPVNLQCPWGGLAHPCGSYFLRSLGPTHLHLFSLAALRTAGPGAGYSSVPHGRDAEAQDWQETCDRFLCFFFFFFLKRGEKKCSKRDLRLNKSNLGFIPGITWIFKNFWKFCLSATALLSNRSYLPNSFWALEFTVERERKKRLSFVPKRFILLVKPITTPPQ